MDNHEKFQKLIQEIKELNPSYTKMVDQYEKENSSVDFPNSSLSHALYIACKMFEHAKEDIYILSGTLHELYSDTIQQLIEIFAGDLKSIKIITLQEKDIEKIVKLKKFVQNFNKQAGKKIVEYMPLENKGNPMSIKHFYVIDGKAWRKEEAHDENLGPDDIHADVCFNNPREGDILKKEFMEFWSRFDKKYILA